MLSQHTVDEIVRLLAQGELSRRRIARKVGASRGIVDAIANNRRGRHGRSEGRGAEMPAAPQRCPSCGASVYMPCIACQARGYFQRRDLEFHLSRRPPRLLRRSGCLRVAAAGTASRVA